MSLMTHLVLIVSLFAALKELFFLCSLGFFLLITPSGDDTSDVCLRSWR